MEDKIIIAGSGGQGVLTLGIFLSRTAIEQGLHTTWLPSYGAEKRGGFSFCQIVISDREIFSPVVERPDTLICFDNRALDTFGAKATDKTVSIINSSIVHEKPAIKGTITMLPAADIAKKINFVKAMNIVAAGAYFSLKKTLATETALKVMNEMLGGKCDAFEINKKAFNEGMSYKN